MKGAYMKYIIRDTYLNYIKNLSEYERNEACYELVKYIVDRTPPKSDGGIVLINACRGTIEEDMNYLSNLQEKSIVGSFKPIEVRNGKE